MNEKLIASLLPILGSGVVAAAVAFLLNLRDERRRAVRDFATKFFETTRGDVRLAMDSGVAYFSSTNARRIRALEANVLLHEHDVRASLTNIVRYCAEDDDTRRLLWGLGGDFLRELTGGDFGTAAPTQDLQRVQAIVLSGARLRYELARLRQDQLDKARLGYGVNRASWFLVGLLLLAAFSFAVGFFAGATIMTGQEATRPAGVAIPPPSAAPR